MDGIDITAVAKGMEAHFKAALTPFDASFIQLSREEAVLTLGLLSALVGILEEDQRARS